MLKYHKLGVQSNIIFFSHNLEAGRPKVWCWQGPVPSEASRLLSLPLSASGSSRCDLVWKPHSSVFYLHMLTSLHVCVSVCLSVFTWYSHLGISVPLLKRLYWIKSPNFCSIISS